MDIDKLLSENPWATRTLNVVAGATLVAAVAWLTFTLTSTRTAELPARVINSITLEPTILLAGKPFRTHVNVTLNRLCPYEVHWSLIRVSDGLEVVKIVEDVVQPPLQLGQQDLTPSQRYVPNSVAPGDYRYVSEVFDHCPDGHSFTTLPYNVAITVR